MSSKKSMAPALSPIAQNAARLSGVGLIIAAVVNPLILAGVGFLFGNPGATFIGAIVSTEILYALVFILFKSQYYYIGRALFSCTLLTAVFSYSSIMGIGSGYEYYFFPIGVGSYLVWPNHRSHQILLTAFAFVLFMFITISAPAGLTASSHWDKAIIYYLFLFNIASAFLTSFIVLYTLAIASEKTQVTLDYLQKKALDKAFSRESQMLFSLNALAHARDNETGNHIIRTQNYIKVLALRLRSEGHFVEEFTDQAIELLFKAAPLHDVGKIGIPDNILLKNGPLTEDEWEIMKTHTLIGESVLDAANIDHDGDSDVIAKAIKVAGGHHEKWDGTGYPRGLAGRAIPLEARLMSLADMYDALVSDRPYKKAWTHEQAVQEIISKRRTQFDPLIVDAFIAEQDTFKAIAEKFRDL